MSLLQIEVTTCEDCPFVWIDKSYHDDHKCNIKEEEILDIDETPHWCPLLKWEGIQIIHTVK